MVYNFFDKKKTSGGTVKNEIIFNKELAEELHKPIIKQFKKRKVYPPFIDNIWGADLADMQLINKFNKGFRICILKYVWVIPLRDKKEITTTDGFRIKFRWIKSETKQNMGR